MITAYLWDVKYDWGFFWKNSSNKFLREELAYPSKLFYYIAIIANLVLRTSWVLLLSPAIINNLKYKHLVTLLIAILENFRRTLWNYFKIELKHLYYVGNFNVI